MFFIILHEGLSEGRRNLAAVPTGIALVLINPPDPRPPPAPISQGQGVFYVLLGSEHHSLCSPFSRPDGCRSARKRKVPSC